MRPKKIARLQHATGEAVKALCDVIKETGAESSAWEFRRGGRFWNSQSRD